MTFKFKKIAGLLMGAMAAFTISVNASAAKTKIADVSQYQGSINWSKASKQLKFAIIRSNMVIPAMQISESIHKKILTPMAHINITFLSVNTVTRSSVAWLMPKRSPRLL